MVAVQALACNAAALPGCLVALSLADRVGRLKMLMASAVAQSLTAILLGGVFLLKTRDNISTLDAVSSPGPY